MVNSELGPLPVNAIASGRLFMPSDFVPAFGPKKGKPMEGLIIEEVQNMALGGEVKEFRRQRNRAMLASWNELKVKSEQEKLRTMTWADLGLRYNIEPFRKESVERYVTLPGAAVDQYVNEANLGFDTLLEHLDVWKAVSPTPFPSFYHDRNFKGGDALRYCYGDIQRMGAKAGPDGVVRLRQPTPTTITFMADEWEAPTEDEGERPPKFKKIRSLAEEEMDEESDDEPLLTKRKKKEVNEQEGQHELFYWQLAGRPDQTAKEEERGTWISPMCSTDMAARREGGNARAPRPRYWRTCLSQTFRSRSRSRSLERPIGEGEVARCRIGGVGHEPARPDKVKRGGPREIPKGGSSATERGFGRAASGYKTRSTPELERNSGS
jgi:hypothetical protein